MKSGKVAVSDPSPTSTNNQIVNKYFARRHFPTPANMDVANMAKTVPISHFAMRNLVLGTETSTNDVVQFSSSISDPQQIDQQYAKFKIWISESPDALKPELAQLLYPTFIHLFLELISSGQKQLAQKFYKRHQSTFLGNQEFASFIRQLSPICSPDDIAKDDAIKAFHNSKYCVTLSNTTFHCLMRYLDDSCGKPPIVLHVLRGKVDLKLADALGASSKSEALKRMENETQALLQDQNAEDKSKQEKTLETLRRLTAEFRTPLPTTCLLKLQNSSSTFTCSKVSLEGATKLITGTEASALHVWNLMPQDNKRNTRKRRRLSGSTSRTLLGCDSAFASLLCDTEESLGTDAIKLLGHRGPIYDVAFARPNSNHVLSVSEDTTMRIWDVDRAVNVAIYSGHSYPVWSVAVDCLGNVVTGSMDRTAKLWHLEYTHPIRIYAGHEDDVDVVKFHPNCNYLATGSVDKSVRLWSHADGKMVRVYSGHKGPVYALAFSPDGKKLASAGEDRRVKIWDLATSSCVKDFKGHTDSIYALEWTSDSSLIASSGLDGTLRFWDVLHEASEPRVASLNTGCSRILDLSFTQQNVLMTTGIEGWDVSAEESTSQRQATMNGSSSLTDS